jgi:hypothetical protein
MAEPSDLRITLTDARRLYCPSGLREWAEERGIDFDVFKRDGIEAEKLLESGDAFAVRLVRLKEREVRRGASR